MATRAFDTLVIKHPDKIASELGKLPELHRSTLARGRQIIRLLALLHDVGHPAFSHAAESALPVSVKGHEDVSAFVIENVLGDLLKSMYFTEAPALLVKLMEKKPEVTFLRQFVVSEMDMDRTDYLRRDSLHCGVDYGHFDFHRLIEAMTVIENPETKQVQIGLERGGEHIFEALILARYQMNTQVYFHRLRRIYDHYLTEFMKSWGPENYKTPEDILSFDDMDLLVLMKREAEHDGPRRELARRISKRDHHRMVYESGDSADIFKVRRAKHVISELKATFPDVDLVADFAETSIHKQMVATDEREDPSSDPLYVANRDGSNPKMISLESSIIQKIPKRFRNVRVYAASANRDLSVIRDVIYKQMNG